MNEIFMLKTGETANCISPASSEMEKFLQKNLECTCGLDWTNIFILLMVCISLCYIFKTKVIKTSYFWISSSICDTFIWLGSKTLAVELPKSHNT